jgi:hypothetical protein
MSATPFLVERRPWTAPPLECLSLLASVFFRLVPIFAILSAIRKACIESFLRRFKCTRFIHDLPDPDFTDRGGSEAFKLQTNFRSKVDKMNFGFGWKPSAAKLHIKCINNASLHHSKNAPLHIGNTATPHSPSSGCPSRHHDVFTISSCPAYRGVEIIHSQTLPSPFPPSSNQTLPSTFQVPCTVLPRYFQADPSSFPLDLKPPSYFSTARSLHEDCDPYSTVD